METKSTVATQKLANIREFLARNKTDSALELAEWLIKNFPDEATAYFLCAEAYLQKGGNDNKDKIIENLILYFNKVYPLNIDNIRYRGRLAEQLLLMGKTDAAIDCYQSIITLKPEAWAYIALGNIFEKKGDITQCIVCFEQALALEAHRTGLQSRLTNLYQRVNKTPLKKHVILVLGMHRSGTSALTRLINLLGADIAPDLMSANFANQVGYWESIELAKIHDEILLALKSSWDDIVPIDYTKLPADIIQSNKNSLKEYLIRVFDHSNFFVIKDPRLCKLIPLWLEVLNDLAIEVKVIIPFRNPLEVAASLRERDGFSVEKSFLIWLRSILDVEQQTRGLARCFINYAQLLDNTASVLNNITQQCDINWPNDLAQVLTEIQGFINNKYHHQRINSEQLQQATISTWIQQAYSLLTNLTQQEANQQYAMEQFDTIADSLQQADKLYGHIIVTQNNVLTQLSSTFNKAISETQQRNARMQQLMETEINAFRERLFELNNMK